MKQVEAVYLEKYLNTYMTELLAYDDEDKIEIGIDEAGRGCLFGEVFVAGVILPKNIKELIEKEEEKIIIKDSKKLSKKRRLKAKEFIERVAVDYCVVSKLGTEEII